jgi:hypothetical protein
MLPLTVLLLLLLLLLISIAATTITITKIKLMTRATVLELHRLELVGQKASDAHPAAAWVIPQPAVVVPHHAAQRRRARLGGCDHHLQLERPHTFIVL